MYLEILSYITNKQERLSDLSEIFFLNAQVPLNDEKEKSSFFQKYAEPYIRLWPDDVFFARDIATNKTLGYLIGCRDSQEASPVFEPLLKSYSLFSDLFKKFPAHLHMNIHPDHHGRGAGSFLVQEYILELRKFGVKGVHLITSPEQKNVDFYLKNKFTYQVERNFNGRPLLFMARAV